MTDIYRQIPIDKSTGLRACKYDPEKTALEVYEFWDSDIFELFRSSGIYKKMPPKYESGCDIDEVSYEGNNPVITSPSNGSEYMISKTGKTELPFAAYTDSGAKKLYWFLNGRLIKTTAEDEQIFWTAEPGDYELRVTDDAGRSYNVYFKVLF